jgi:hypothetical protein
MDQFADRMCARGPTLAPDRETWTGSLHIIDLPDANAAREFVAAEPFERAGLFLAHRIRRFRDRLGRTMWDFNDDTDEPRFLVIAGHELTVPRVDALILYGDLLSDDSLPAGSALAARASSRAQLGVLLGGGDLEIQAWEFGGRR